MTDVQKSNIVKPGQELDPLQNGYLAAELERAGGKKRGNLVRSDFAEWLLELLELLELLLELLEWR